MTMRYQQKQVAAQALRVAMSCARWEINISTISGGNRCCWRVSVDVFECLHLSALLSLALERYQMVLAKDLAPIIDYNGTRDTGTRWVPD